MSEFLKCDNEACGVTHDVGAITEDMIGTPCPKCGSDLLTKADWDFYVSVMKPGMEAMVALGLTKPAGADTPEHLRMSVNSHNGELRIKFPEAVTTKPN